MPLRIKIGVPFSSMPSRLQVGSQGRKISVLHMLLNGQTPYGAGKCSVVCFKLQNSSQRVSPEEWRLPQRPYV